MNSEVPISNESLRRARALKGWSQAELAEQVGTSFEMVSRWERGITIPSPRYRIRLCEVLGQTAEELGLVRDLKIPLDVPASPFVVLASSHVDAEKAIVSHLKMVLQKRGITLWSSRQIGKQGDGNTQVILREVIHATSAIFVILSPQARSSRLCEIPVRLLEYISDQCMVFGSRASIWNAVFLKAVSNLLL